MPTNISQISYIQTLSQAGLTPDQALIYEVLLKNGPLPAGKIHTKTPFKRGLVYKLLDQMQELGIVTKKDIPGKIAIFEPAHPLKLKELAEKKEEQAKSAQMALSGVLDAMTSEYNFAIGKPGVQFYEGLEGVKKVVADTLTATDEVLQILDVEQLEKKFTDESKFFTSKRIGLKIKKRILVKDSEFAQSQNLIDDNFTQYRLFQSNENLDSITYLYNDKLTMITLEQERMMGTIISNSAIYKTQKQIFETIWQNAQQSSLAPRPSNASSEHSSNLLTE